MASARSGQALFWEGGSLWIGMTDVRSDYHAHHAIQLGLALSGTCQFKTRRDSDWVHYSGAVTPPNFEHSFQAPGKLVANLFCEPESAVGRMIASRLNPKTITPLDAKTASSIAANLREAFLTGADTEALERAAKKCFTKLVDGAQFVTPTDPRVEKAVAEIMSRLDQPLTLADVARSVNLSESRWPRRQKRAPTNHVTPFLVR